MVSLQVVPAEFALKSGNTQAFQVYGLDKSGKRVKLIKEDMTWEKWIPESAKVKSEVDAYISHNGILSAERKAKLSAGALRVKVGDLYGVTRGRVLQDLPYEENFEKNFKLVKRVQMEFSFLILLCPGWEQGCGGKYNSRWKPCGWQYLRPSFIPTSYQLYWT